MEEISFVLYDAKDEKVLDLFYARQWANNQYGRDVRLFADSENEFANFLQMKTSAEPTQKTSQGAKTFSLKKLGKNGEILASRSPLTDDEKQLAENVVFNYMIKSAAWDGVDLASLDECYLLQAVYPGETAATDYYAFVLDGYACLQSEKDGRYSRIDDSLFDALAEIMNRQAAAGQIVEGNLAVIMSSPRLSSNSADYIEAHRTEYEKILDLGDDALFYMLSCFEKGEADTLKGYIMMSLSNKLLGTRSNLGSLNLIPPNGISKSAVSSGSRIDLPDGIKALAIPTFFVKRLLSAADL